MKKRTNKTLIIGGGILGTFVIIGLVYYFFFYKKETEQEDKKEPLKADKVYTLGTKQLADSVTNKANITRYSPEFMENVRKNAAASKRLDERNARDRARKAKMLADQLAKIENELNT